MGIPGIGVECFNHPCRNWGCDKISFSKEASMLCRTCAIRSSIRKNALYGEHNERGTSNTAMDSGRESALTKPTLGYDWLLSKPGKMQAGSKNENGPVQFVIAIFRSTSNTYFLNKGLACFHR